MVLIKNCNKLCYYDVMLTYLLTHCCSLFFCLILLLIVADCCWF